MDESTVRSVGTVTPQEFQNNLESGKYYFSVTFYIYHSDYNGPMCSIYKPDDRKYVHVTHEFIGGSVIAHLTANNGAYQYISVPFSPDMDRSSYRKRVLDESIKMINST